MEIPLLDDIAIIFGLSILVISICHRLRVPSIVGFLLTGILAGPHGLGLIGALGEVETMAEIGVVLLLFAIGIEFSLQNLVRIRKSVLMGGSLQVLLTIPIVFLISRQLGQGFSESIFLGFLVSLSSTAIVLKLMQERAEIDSPHGRTSIGILIFQDMIVILMILFTPLLAGATTDVGGALLILAAQGLGIILLVFVSAKWIVPQVMYQVVRTKNRELFLMTIIVICLAVAWLTSSIGLSLALGAFLAGLIISDSEYAHQALGNILPFRDVFMAFFFVSIGMLLDIDFLLQNLGLVVLIASGVLILKTLIICLVTILLGLPLRTAILTGFALSQVGEFSLILSETGIENGLLTGNVYQMFLAVTVLTMALTSFIITASPRAADAVVKLPLPAALIAGLHPVPEIKDAAREDHLIIIGFGMNGTNLARAARAAGIQYVIIEMNPETVRTVQASGEPIYYGDATHEAVLQHANINSAKVVVVAISDPAATRRITETLRRLNPDAYIIARTRYLSEMKPLYGLGADEVIPEEFETSIEIFTRVLTKYLIPSNEIEGFIAEIRSDGYEMLRSLTREHPSFSDLKLHIPDIEISSLRVSEQSTVVGRTVAHIGFRSEYGVTLLVVRRDSQVLPNPGGDVQIFAGDVLVVLGQPEKIAGVKSLLYPVSS